MSYIGHDCCESSNNDTVTNKYKIIQKTSNFTAEKFNYYFINTVNGSITVTLPAGSEVQDGDWIGFVDSVGHFGTNNLIVLNNTNTIRNNNDSLVVDLDYINFKLIYNSGNWAILDMSMSGYLLGEEGSGGNAIYNFLNLRYTVTEISGVSNTIVGNYYIVNTSNAVATINLPSSPTNGDWLILSDKNKTFGTNKATLVYTDKTIAQNVGNVELDVNGAKVLLVYYNNNWDILSL